jgi:hypothetical protein
LLIIDYPFFSFLLLLSILAAIQAEPEPLPTDNVILTSNQKVIFQQLKDFHEESRKRTIRSPLEPLYFPGSVSQKERQFIKRVCTEFCLNTDVYDGQTLFLLSSSLVIIFFSFLFFSFLLENDKGRITVWYDHSADLMKIVPQHHFDEVMAKYKNAKIYVDEYEVVGADEVRSIFFFFFFF